jgi:hypothetical protein
MRQCSRWDWNPQSQQENGRRPANYVAGHWDRLYRAKLPLKELCLIDDGTVCITIDRNDDRDWENRSNVYGIGLFKIITGGTQHNGTKFLRFLKPCSKSLWQLLIQTSCGSDCREKTLLPTLRLVLRSTHLPVTTVSFSSTVSNRQEKF